MQKFRHDINLLRAKRVLSHKIPYNEKRSFMAKNAKMTIMNKKQQKISSISIFAERLNS